MDVLPQHQEVPYWECQSVSGGLDWPWSLSGGPLVWCWTSSGNGWRMNPRVLCSAARLSTMAAFESTEDCVLLEAAGKDFLVGTMLG